MNAWAWGGIAYGVTGLIAARLIAGHFAYEFGGQPEVEDWVMGTMIGCLVGSVWPAVVALVALGRLFVSLPICLGAERQARKRARHVQTLERESRMQRLERELGIGR